MELYSLEFFVFTGILMLLYYTVFRRRQWICLLAGSLLFYWLCGGAAIVYVCATSLTVWLGSRMMKRFFDGYDRERKREGITREEKKQLKNKLKRKNELVAAVVAILNFGALAYFKYWNVLLSAILKSSANEIGISRLLLPLGISFYTFQAMGYLLDVMWKKYPAEENYFKFLLFVSFFPQLLQGPINRFDAMGSQLFSEHTPDWDRFRGALVLFLFGAMKKYAIANLLVNQISDIFDNPTDGRSGSLILLGILMYSAQQYADFSGGIDMVMAVAELFGIRMGENFRQPYFSVSIADFWRRWHISLGAWMRDYVFYPFAMTQPMKRLGKWSAEKFNRNIGAAAIGNLLVFFIVGIWHGAQIHYILWGMYNGLIIAISEICKPLFDRQSALMHLNTESKGFRVFQIVRTFVLVNIGWYFDRIESLRDCLICFRNTFTRFDFSFLQVRQFIRTQFINQSYVLLPIVFLALAIVFINSILCERGTSGYAVLQEKPLPLKWLVYFAMIFLTLASFMFSGGSGGFLYANF